MTLYLGNLHVAPLNFQKAMAMELTTTSTLLTSVLCISIIGIQLVFQVVQTPVTQLRARAAPQQQQDSTALRFLNSAAAAAHNSSRPSNHTVWRQSYSCQPSRSSLQEVHAVATAFRGVHQHFISAGVPGTANSAQQAHQVLEALRQQLAQRWVAALRPLHPISRSSKLKSAADATSQGGGCRSVWIPPLQAIGSNSSRSTSSNVSTSSVEASTTLLLVLNSWDRLEHQVERLALSLSMIWSYASMHGYDLHIYIHSQALPPWMPVYFIKPPGILHLMRDWGYSHVAYLDWDVFISPHTAPPLSLFYTEYPAASLLQQGEYNLCAGVNLWRNTPHAQAILTAWWEMGYAGCCPTTQHDQSALKHIVAAYLANFTREAGLYGRMRQRHFSLPPKHPAVAAAEGQHKSAEEWQRIRYTTESPPMWVATYLRLRPLLQRRGSAIGLVGLDAHLPTAAPGNHQGRVALTSCLGTWWGCVPADTPALLYHVGHSFGVSPCALFCMGTGGVGYGWHSTCWLQHSVDMDESADRPLLGSCSPVAHKVVFQLILHTACVLKKTSPGRLPLAPCRQAPAHTYYACDSIAIVQHACSPCTASLQRPQTATVAMLIVALCHACCLLHGCRRSGPPGWCPSCSPSCVTGPLLWPSCRQ